MGMIIDGHHHLWSDWPDGRRYFPWRQGWEVCMRWAYGGIPPYNKDPKTFFPRQMARMSDYEGKYTVESLDYWKMDAAVLFPVDYDLCFGQEAGVTWDEKHQHASSLAQKYPGRLLPFIQIDPRRTNANELMKRALDEYKNFFALKLVPAVGFYPWDPTVYPLYEMCMEYDIPVAFCVEGSQGGYRYERFAYPSHVNDMLAEFRDLRVILLHTGFPYLHWFEMCVYYSEHINCYCEFGTWLLGNTTGGGRSAVAAPTATPNRFNSADQLITMLARLKTAGGPHKMIWGIDGRHGPAYYKDTDGFDHSGSGTSINWMKNLPETAAKLGLRFTPDEVELMLGENIARVLKIKKDPQWDRPYNFGWKYRFPSPNRSRP